MMKRKIFCLLIVGIGFLLLLMSHSNAQSAIQPTQEHQRSTQLLRDIYVYGNPERYWLFTDVERFPASIISSPSDYPPSWGTMVFQTYRNRKWDLYTLQPDGTENKLNPGKGTSAYPALQNNAYQIAYENDGYGNMEILSMLDVGGGIRRLTNHPAYDSLPAWSPDGNWIAFTSDRLGNSDLFVMDNNGENVAALTNSSAYDGEPTWSPDGSQVAFVSDRTGISAIWIMNADGTDQHQITSGPTAFTPAWSPRGDSIAFAQDSDGDSFYEVWIIDLDPLNIRKLDVPSNYHFDFWAPAWSPDGEWLAYIATSWIEYEGRWYWSQSFLFEKHLSQNGELLEPSTDNLIWHADWAAKDTLPPDPCTVIIQTPQPVWSEIPVKFSAQDQGPSGISAYDAQYRLLGGEWQDWVKRFHSDGAIYSGTDSRQVEFRCRAYDWVGYIGEWSTTPTVSPAVDSLRPVSIVHSLQRLIRGNSAMVSWGGADQGSGIVNYGIWVRDGQGGNWVRWLTHTTDSQKTYTGQSGHTYFFRSQAHDQVGHTEPWQPGAQASTTFYSTLLTITVTDQRENPIPASSIVIQPAAAFTSTHHSPGEYLLYLDENDSHTIAVTSTGFTSPPPAEIPTQGDSRFNTVLLPHIEAVADGGFEKGTLSDWSVSGSGASVSASQPHTGAYALQLSHATPATTTVSQTINLENIQNQPTLSFWYHIPADLVGGEFVVQVQGILSSTILSASVSTGGWAHTWADLSSFSGQVVTLTLSLHAGSGTVFVDEVSSGPWETPLITSVTPLEWPKNRSVILTIHGLNFIQTQEVHLGDESLMDVTWINATQLTASVPASYPAGIYDLLVSNPGGASYILFDAVKITSKQVFLPITQNQYTSTKAPVSADWAMFGYNNARTGYNLGESGASRYSLVWSLQFPQDNCNYIEPIIVADGVLVTHGSCDTQLLALDAETGSQLWYYTDPNFGFMNAPTIANGLVYYSFENTLHALNLYNGTQVWSAPGVASWNPVIAEHRIYKVSSTYSALNASTGTQDWISHFHLPRASDSTITYDQGVLYSWMDGVFRAINPRTGGLIWSLTIDPDMVGWASQMPLIVGRIAIVGTAYPQKIYAINLDTRQIQWSVVPENAHGSGEPFLAVADGFVYSVSGQLNAYNLDSGNMLWSFTVSGFNETLAWNPIVTQKYIYVASGGPPSNTYVLDRTTHQVVWQTDAGGYLTVADGYLYITAVAEYTHVRTIRAYQAQEP